MTRAALAWIESVVPALGWGRRYERADLSGDVLAGIITAILLVPQSIAYAMLAGLPPQIGLYMAVLPPVLYGLFGTSRTLSVGPVAVASIMVASIIGGLGLADMGQKVVAAAMLAMLTGAVLLAMGLARLGFLVNFLGHPVLSGFISAAAILIAVSQLKHLFGVSVPRADNIVAAIYHLVRALPETNPATLGLGLGALVLLVIFQRGLGLNVGLVRRQLPALFSGVPTLLKRGGPLAVVALGAMIVWHFGLAEGAGVSIVGRIPEGLPAFSLPWPGTDVLGALVVPAILVALIAYTESVSVAKALASRRRQKIQPNRELIGLGIANLGAGLSSGCPVAGGFGRSVVNFNAGANTQLSTFISSALVALAAIFFTPLFYYLPDAVLAAIVIIAVFTLVDFSTLRETFRYDRGDALSLVATFLGVLLLGVELGIVVGIMTSLGLFLWRTSRPHVAIVGRVPGTEHYRNVRRHRVETDPAVLAIRLDENLYFANAGQLEDTVLEEISDRPAVRHVVLICSAVNLIDASALESLERLIENLRVAGVTLHLAEVKGPVMDRLERSDLLKLLAPGRVYLSTHEAVQSLGELSKQPDTAYSI